MSIPTSMLPIRTIPAVRALPFLINESSINFRQRSFQYACVEQVKLIHIGKCRNADTPATLSVEAI